MTCPVCRVAECPAGWQTCSRRCRGLMVAQGIPKAQHRAWGRTGGRSTVVAPWSALLEQWHEVSPREALHLAYNRGLSERVCGAAEESEGGMTVGSLFSGVGGFDLGFARAGFEVCWQVEIEPFCQCILARHWPAVRRYDDVTLLSGADLTGVDVLCAGVPCQDWSIAGRRAGIDGARSGLFFHFVRLVREMSEATHGRCPTMVVFENVPGLFSAGGGRDFHTVLTALDECGLDLAWRVLDSQYFGVAQRRRRVFVVGCSRASGIDPAQMTSTAASAAPDTRVTSSKRSTIGQ